jgi:hypothetical protein
MLSCITSVPDPELYTGSSGLGGGAVVVETLIPLELAPVSPLALKPSV